ncbi:MAG: hypothetical protein WD795_20785 [Woeseia sp.]
MNHCLVHRLAAVLAAGIVLAACGGEHSPAGHSVVSSGKEATGLEAVPAEVLQAARAARPELRIEDAEQEVRGGQEYYDIAGKMPDGSELELDMTTVDGAWTVVEIQRDIALVQVAEGARQALSTVKPDWGPTRIIESDQGDGVIIYEFLGPGPDSGEIKIEVKLEDNQAEALRDEWVH